jgi:hypothetical protein
MHNKAVKPKKMQSRNKGKDRGRATSAAGKQVNKCFYAANNCIYHSGINPERTGLPKNK